MALEIVNEGSTAYLTVAFTDKNGAAAAPTTVTYRIDCLTNGTEVKDDTSLSPGTSVEITITATENAIISQSNALEKRVVTVIGSYGTGDAVKNEYQYWVKNLSKVPSPA